ncbi:hypothetical protein Barb6_00156 [Bacteroidales bacterium Barb6]|nr:hypothetical protein Barb6_00156 [Bacteroidales bacterium Barb6]
MGNLDISGDLIQNNTHGDNVSGGSVSIHKAGSADCELNCFVIQPFDDGKYDKLFNESFKPTIEKAGLNAYRVDEDPAASNIIESIENGIAQSFICLAEITMDNPNIWYELGFAFACRKEVVMVCSKEREKFPFDVSHKKIIRYDSNVKSDFEKLEKDVADRIIACRKKVITMQKTAVIPIHTTNNGLRDDEIIMLILIRQNSIINDIGIPEDYLQRRMNKIGYSRFNVVDTAGRLMHIGMIECFKDTGRYGTVFSACKLTENGKNWIILNRETHRFLEIHDRIQNKKGSSNTKNQ